MFNLKNVDTQSTNVQSLTSENLKEAAINALLSQILLSFKFKIIKFEKIKIYKKQAKTNINDDFRNAKIKMMSASEYFAIDKVKIL